MEHQEDACDREDDKKEAGNASKTECIGELEAMTFDFCWKDMEKEVVIN
jgi:hypothetical protein